MEDVLDVYHMPYDSSYPVVCMDESCKQLVGEVRDPIPCKPGHPKRIDDEYVRKGVVEIFMEVEPLAGKRHVAVTERRTRKDWAQQIKQMLDDRYPDAIKVRLVMDNLDTHHIDAYVQWGEESKIRNVLGKQRFYEQILLNFSVIKKRIDTKEMFYGIGLIG